MASVATPHARLPGAGKERRSSPASSSTPANAICPFTLYTPAPRGGRSERLFIRSLRPSIRRPNPAVAAVSSSELGASRPIQTDRIRERRLTVPIKKASDRGEICADLDQWIRCSVTEIVRHVEEAPLLVHVYGEGARERGGLKLMTEKGVEEDWGMIKGRWEGGSCESPDGIILVEELKSSEEVNKTLIGVKNNMEAHSSGTKIWGLLIQGRGQDGGACYVLKTCRVGSALGFCTHFCLARADCLAESAEWHLKKLWLARGGGAGVVSGGGGDEPYSSWP